VNNWNVLALVSDIAEYKILLPSGENEAPWSWKVFVFVVICVIPVPSAFIV
jgi:hypothetical protein